MRASGPKVVVLGAGITGLAAAYRLGKRGNTQVHVIDKEGSVGGACRSFTDGDFILDYGPHKFYTLLDGILDEVKTLMGDELLEREKRQCLYMRGKYFQYPLKMGEMLTRFPPAVSAQVLFSYGLQTLRNITSKQIAVSYEDFLTQRFGRRLYQEIFEPMARKIYGAPELLDRKLAEVRISSPGLMSVVKQMVLGKSDRTESAPNFHYPKYGYGRLGERLKEESEKVGVHFHLDAKLERLEQSADGKVSKVIIRNHLGQTEHIDCDYVVYTIPIHLVNRLLSHPLPAPIQSGADSIRYRHTIVYYYLLRSRPLLPAMWVFFPESRFRFGRLSEMIQFSPLTAPPGHTSLMVDFTCDSEDPYWSMDDETLGNSLFEQMKPLRLFQKDQIQKKFSRRFRDFYPTYSIGYQRQLAAIRKLEEHLGNLFFLGRVGDFNYNNSDQCLDMGFRVADHLVEAHAESDSRWSSWKSLRENHFERYRIVD